MYIDERKINKSAFLKTSLLCFLIFLYFFFLFFFLVLCTSDQVSKTPHFLGWRDIPELFFGKFPQTEAFALRNFFSEVIFVPLK